MNLRRTNHELVAFAVAVDHMGQSAGNLLGQERWAALLEVLAAHFGARHYGVVPAEQIHTGPLVDFCEPIQILSVCERQILTTKISK